MGDGSKASGIAHLALPSTTDLCPLCPVPSSLGPCIMASAASAQRMSIGVKCSGGSRAIPTREDDR